MLLRTNREIFQILFEKFLYPFINYGSTPPLTNLDQEYLTQFHALVEDVTEDMENYRFHLASEKLYAYVWHVFADDIIEKSKEIFQNGKEEEKTSTSWLVYHILITSLAMLHPFIPFITEELWSVLPHQKTKPLLMVEQWPTLTK